MNEHDSWLVDFTQSVSAYELKRNVTFRFIDGGFGQLTVEEILLHLLTHGSNHR
ncbi:dinB family protein, partial [Vibrio paracholerae 87395]